jgi:hypothetical protein
MAVPEPEKTLFETDLTEYSTIDIEGVGSVRKDRYGRVYKWVENLNASTAFLVGQPVNYDASVAAATRFNGVLATAAADEEMLAGVAMSVIPAGSYGWIQCKGLNASTLVDAASATIAIGDTLSIASTKTNFTEEAAGGGIGTNAPAVAWEAYATATTTTVSSIAVMLNCAV